ncbi:hypothetical protein [Nocardiopsis synnemataformans]|uniref:hypothetical protein n=1 Tax=Nocardiopsis synnemataformans TaxID=61305 RepID=UPI003EBA35C2
MTATPAKPTTDCEPMDLDLVKVTTHVLTTTRSHDPGATLIERQRRRGSTWTLVDHGRGLARTAELLYQVYRSDRPAACLLLLAGHERSGETPDKVRIRDWVPAHISVLSPGQLSPGGTPLPHVPRARAYRVGSEQAIIWSPDDDVVIAGDLLAPDLPDLSHISPRQAMDGLHYAASQGPLVTIGSHGNVIDARPQVAAGTYVPPHKLATVADMRTRIAYIQDIATVAYAGVRQELTPRRAACQGWEHLSHWTGRDQEQQVQLNRRHLVNLHSAMAAVRGETVDLAAAHADAATL